MTVVRAAGAGDFDDLLALYAEFGSPLPVLNEDAGRARFAEILSHPGTTVFGAEADGRLVSTVTLHVMPNLTNCGRPYALIENVITLRAYQGRGIGRAVMQAAQEAAWAKDAYKIMLLTGQTSGARGFYEKLGYSAEEKTGMTLRRTPTRSQPV